MPEVDTLKISNDDAAFILGKNGKTKEKIARVSGADLDLFEQSLTLEIRGTDAERRRAKKYAHLAALDCLANSACIQRCRLDFEHLTFPMLLGTSNASWLSVSGLCISKRRKRMTTSP